ncbi:Kip1p NDAI_0E04300 [Naumovozyma dairenensis CBS 421]|uniref:Kinesin-like protein KIP1 n=1 Tax=Naumovozyma dairenensis (strain ATCC 10597 / BCRC 20456 / CBS 421 / NBRC 0211 / NRRL Y-12639) TaxID=1071378 RepID=G0WBX7_NAUDC|nr:hypothetical protein NDAI_0E04300 [Naumovozyma dairenensis CBS 421]CCD25247.1 hypothetical protein NDAI_0E04300 [Naumovozyma dairenensis CBS 421]
MSQNHQSRSAMNSTSGSRRTTSIGPVPNLNRRTTISGINNNTNTNNNSKQPFSSNFDKHITPSQRSLTQRRQQKKQRLSPINSSPSNSTTSSSETNILSSSSSPSSTNIKVYVRCRSRSEREIKEKSSVVISTLGPQGNQVILSNPSSPLSYPKKSYSFDRVFGAESDQETVFNDAAKNYISEMLSGYNCTVFAYGQTGTGKTYTMSGDLNILGNLESKDMILLGEHAGIIPRVLVNLFKMLALENDYSVKISFLELYNERLKDLFAQNESEEETIRIFDNNNNASSSIMVKGMEEIYIKSAHEGLQLLMDGSLKRKVASTKCNDLSSRSHTVFTIATNITKIDPISGEQYIKTGKLNLVDLAGSENINRSGAENKRAQEAGLINKSLLTLGRVINALVDHSQHIPYRESKLTRLLQDSLGGKTKTCIIATISPAKISMEETVSTLEYAIRAKSIKNTPQINQSMSKDTCINEYVSEIERLRLELKTSRQKDGICITQDQLDLYESNGILVDEQKTKIHNMEEQIQKFKEKYVRQTELNKNLESNLKENEQVTKQLRSEKYQLMDLLENYQINSNSFVQRVLQIHESNIALIQNLDKERNRIHHNSTQYMNNMEETFNQLSIQRDELLRLKNSLQSYNINFNDVMQSVFNELETNVVANQKETSNKLGSISLMKTFELLQNLELTLAKDLNLLNEPYLRDTNHFLISHKTILEECYNNVHSCTKSMEGLISTQLTDLNGYLSSSFKDLEDQTIEETEDLKQVIISQQKKIQTLEHQFMKEKESTNSLNENLQSLKSYFQDHVSKERSNIFKDIKNIINQAEKKQTDLDVDILQRSENVLTQFNKGLQERQDKQMSSLLMETIASLLSINEHTEKLPFTLKESFDRNKTSLETRVKEIPIQKSFNEIITTVKDRTNIEVSNNLEKLITKFNTELTSGLTSKQISIQNAFKTLHDTITEENQFNENNLESIKSKLSELYHYILNDYKDNTLQISKSQSDIIIDHCSSVESVMASINEPIQQYSQPNYPILKLEVNNEIIDELPKLSKPKNFHIYTEMKNSSSSSSSEFFVPNAVSPMGHNMVDPTNYIPSTPVPVPDQPLPKVLVPKSINSNNKRAVTMPIVTAKNTNAIKNGDDTTSKPGIENQHPVNNLKRRFTTVPNLRMDNKNNNDDTSNNNNRDVSKKARLDK